MRWTLAVLRVLVGALMVTAVFSQLAVSLAYWHRIGIRDIGLRAVDFFSAFTFEFNLAGAAVLFIGAGMLLRGRGAGPRWYVVARLCVLCGLLLTGVVYNLLLRGLPVPAGSQLDWANNTIHVVAPLALAADWLIAPRPAVVRFRAAWWVTVFPVIWLAYTLIRAPFAPDEIAHTPYFYPYGFLDPHGAAGWGGVVMIVSILIPFIFVIGLIAVASWRVQHRLGRSRQGAQRTVA